MKQEQPGRSVLDKEIDKLNVFLRTRGEWSCPIVGHRLPIKQLRALRDDSSGATAVEYGLIAMLVSVALIGALLIYSEAMTAVYEADTAAIDGVIAGD